MHDLLGRRDRDGKANAHAAARPGINGRVDAHQVAIHIHQCTARVAGVDGSIGLDEVFERVDAQLAAAQGADDARCHGLAHAKGVANGQHHIAYLQVLGLSQHNHGQFVERDFQQCQIGVRVGANDFGRSTAAIGQHDFDVVRILNDMVVGQDVAFGADNDATAQPGWILFFLLTIEKFEPRVLALGAL